MERKIVKEDFKNIGIKARMAYGICCLENALVHYNKNISEWEELLSLLWEFPPKQTMYNEWSEKFNEYTPSTIFEYSFKSGEWRCTEETYNYYKDLYSRTEKPILDIIEQLINISDEELYVGMTKYSPDTLAHVETVLDIMYTNNIQLPEVSKFTKYAFDVQPKAKYGWGLPFNGKEELSRFK